MKESIMEELEKIISGISYGDMNRITVEYELDSTLTSIDNELTDVTED